MKILTLALITLIFTSTACFADYQTISDDALIKVNTTAFTIKENLRLAATSATTATASKKTIEGHPLEYDIQLIKDEWDEVIADLMAGKFCHSCHRSKKELETAGINFYEHAADNGGVDPAKQSDIDAANDKYKRKWDVATEIHATYDKAKSDRWSYAFKAQALISMLLNNIQTTYDFQLKVYFPIKKNATDVFGKLSELFSVENDQISETDPQDAKYDSLVIERLSTIRDIDSELSDLNSKRSQVLKAAENKKGHCLNLIQEIQSVANSIGNDDVPSGQIIAANFNFTPDRGVYLGMRSAERLENFYSMDMVESLKNFKSQANDH
jgi:hypothetical protein